MKIHDRALRLLSFRWRSDHEMLDRLRRAGFEEDLIQAEMARLHRAGLMDDQRFAQEYASSSVRFQKKGRFAVRAGLYQKGIDRQIVDEVVEDSSQDEEVRALELASKRAPRLRGLERQVAYQRLVGFLVRRGYPSGTAYAAARTALEVDPAEANGE